MVRDKDTIHNVICTENLLHRMMIIAEMSKARLSVVADNETVDKTRFVWIFPPRLSVVVVADVAVIQIKHRLTSIQETLVDYA